ncbi:MAG: hypothetical protein A2669_02240 [Candidatus Yanofskybacteria bacterium RIFCSPHIGHO2_01_FULL_48_25b]|uniref:Uncharacterized protein n=1 Tax=Candidatus Yanofskybacteria bacterium RIFCSPHIGHO2_01_FULL_48_25b TaxID=1802672 RepID=A0A1F8F1P3_9BACT|nr:MAG: hypothetical protein A2669_02240 [Candidatus Yanofskybacteria bacterium RIFCSPHIGHO2_01_FULL_48_25b]
MYYIISSRSEVGTDGSTFYRKVAQPENGRAILDALERELSGEAGCPASLHRLEEGHTSQLGKEDKSSFFVLRCEPQAQTA